MGKATASSDADFEVQQLHTGGWNCVSTHNSQVAAVDVATAMVEQNQKVQARVVHEVFDLTSNRYVNKIIFRSQPPIDKRKLQDTLFEMDISRRAKTRRRNQSQHRSDKATRRREARRNLLFCVRIVLLILFGGGGLVAFYALS